MKPEWFFALGGGALIGLAATLLWSLNGRIAGISGILNGALTSRGAERFWRVSFIGGLLAGGLCLRALRPEVLVNTTATDGMTTVIAGVLVGFGALLGNGCTSGHGVCGISRLSRRSIVATLTFIATGVLTVAMTRWWGGLP